MERLAKEYKEVFEGIGKYKGPPIEIQIKEGVRPVVQPPRSCWRHESSKDRCNIRTRGPG